VKINNLMKISKSALLILTFFILSLSSCQKFAYDNDDETDNDTSSAGMTFKLDGTSKKANYGAGAIAQQITFAGINSVQIIGQVSEVEGVTIMISEFKGVGDYVDDDLIFVYLKNNDPNQNDRNAYSDKGGGKVKITSITDKLIKGSFQFTGYNSFDQAIVVSEGKFEAKLIVTAVPI